MQVSKLQVPFMGKGVLRQADQERPALCWCFGVYHQQSEALSARVVYAICEEISTGGPFPGGPLPSADDSACEALAGGPLPSADDNASERWCPLRAADLPERTSRELCIFYSACSCRVIIAHSFLLPINKLSRFCLSTINKTGWVRFSAMDIRGYFFGFCLIRVIYFFGFCHFRAIYLFGFYL